MRQRQAKIKSIDLARLYPADVDERIKENRIRMNENGGDCMLNALFV